VGKCWPFVLGGPVLAVGILATLWDWDWFRPLVAHEASAALGRSVTMRHFDLRLGRQTLESLGFAQNFLSSCELEALHFIGIGSFGEEFREDVVFRGIQEQFRKPLA
jgi:hypothetical protein